MRSSLRLFAMKFVVPALLLASSSVASALTVTPFSLPWMNSTTTPRGNYVSADHTNGIFVVEAYFLGCPYCNENAQNVNDLATAYENESRVQVLDVGIDRSPSQYDEWIRRHSPNHPVLMDASRTLIRQLGTSGYPSTYVLNCRGEVVYTGEGGPWEAAEKAAIKAAIDGLLAQECAP